MVRKTYVHKCDICEKVFDRPGRLKAHKLNHQGIRQFKCDQCGKEFVRQTDLTRHLKTHSTAKPYVCETCGKGFKREDTLFEHQLVHLTEKVHSCHICPNKYKRKNALALHLRVHAGKRDIECDLCGRKFITRTHFIQHKQIHAKLKPFKCPQCQKTFRLKTVLREHYRIHTGEKPYTCKFCKKGFNKKCDLKRHLKLHQKPSFIPKHLKEKKPALVSAHFYIHKYKKSFVPGKYIFQASTVVSTGYKGKVLESQAFVVKVPFGQGTGTPTNHQARTFARNLGESTDQACHIVARQLGGSGRDLTNIFPSSRQTNLRYLHNFERNVARIARYHKQVTFEVKLNYNRNSDTRPTSLSGKIESPGGQVIDFQMDCD